MFTTSPFLWVLIGTIILLIIIIIIVNIHKPKEGISGGVIYDPNNIDFSPMNEKDRFINSRGITFSADSYNTSKDGINVSPEIFNNVFVGNMIGTSTWGSTITKKILPDPADKNFVLGVNVSNPIPLNDLKDLYITYDKPSNHVIIRNKTTSGRGSGTLLNDLFVITAAHVIEPSDLAINKDLIKQYIDASNAGLDYVKTTFMKITVNKDTELRYLIAANFLKDDINWITVDAVYVPIERYKLNGSILEKNDFYDMAILKMNSPIPVFSNIDYHVTSNIQFLLNQDIVPLDIRGAVQRDSENYQTPIFPFKQKTDTTGNIIPGSDSYIISNGPNNNNLTLATANIINSSVVKMPYESTPLIFTRTLAMDDCMEGCGTELDTYSKNNTGTDVMFGYSHAFKLSGGKNTIQMFGIGDPTKAGLCIGIGYVGSKFGIVKLDRFANIKEVIELAKPNTDHNNYIIMYTGYKGIFSKTYDFTIGYADGTSVKSVELKELPAKMFFSIMITENDGTGMAVPLYMSTITKRIYLNRGSFYSTPAGSITSDDLLHATKTGVITVPDIQTIPENNVIFFTSFCQEPSGSGLCNDIPSNYNNPINNGPLAITNTVGGDSGGGAIYTDDKGNQYLVGVLHGGLPFSSGTEVLPFIYSHPDKFGWLTSTYNFQHWIDKILNTSP